MMKETLQSVAKDLLTSLDGDLTARSMKELQTIIGDGEDTQFGAFDTVRATVARSSDTYYSGDAEVSCCSSGSDSEVDEETGDLYRSYHLVFSVSWSSHNERVTGVLSEKLHLMTRAATVAATLQDKYSEKYRILVRTAAEEAARKAAEEKAETLSKVKTLSEHAVKGLRSGGSGRDVNRLVFQGIPDGTYEIAYRTNNDTKRYVVNIRSWGASVRRVS